LKRAEITEAAVHMQYTSEAFKRRGFVLTWIIIILIVLWLLGYFGPNVFSGFPRMGNLVHALLVIAVMLIILRVLGIM
jgi:uncharacterized protein DUF5670